MGFLANPRGKKEPESCICGLCWRATKEPPDQRVKVRGANDAGLQGRLDPGTLRGVTFSSWWWQGCMCMGWGWGPCPGNCWALPHCPPPFLALNLFFSSSIGTELLFFIGHMATLNEGSISQPPKQLNLAIQMGCIQ